MTIRPGAHNHHTSTRSSIDDARTRRATARSTREVLCRPPSSRHAPSGDARATNDPRLSLAENPRVRIRARRPRTSSAPLSTSPPPSTAGITPRARRPRPLSSPNGPRRRSRRRNPPAQSIAAEGECHRRVPHCWRYLASLGLQAISASLGLQRLYMQWTVGSRPFIDDVTFAL